MLKKYSIVIADTSCLILLDKINELDLLQRLFGSVSTTPEIVAEFNIPIPSWMSVKSAINPRVRK